MVVTFLSHDLSSLSLSVGTRSRPSLYLVSLSFSTSHLSLLVYLIFLFSLLYHSMYLICFLHICVESWFQFEKKNERARVKMDMNRSSLGKLKDEDGIGSGAHTLNLNLSSFRKLCLGLNAYHEFIWKTQLHTMETLVLFGGCFSSFIIFNEIIKKNVKKQIKINDSTSILLHKHT